MVDWVNLVLRAGYYYGQIIGATNFEVDWRTGRVFKSTRSSLYAIACNVIVVMLLGLKLTEKEILTVIFGETQLYVYVVFTLTILRIAAGLVTLLNQWRYQSQLILLVKNTLRLYRANSQLIRKSRWRVLLMFLICNVPDFFQVTFTFWTINQADKNICQSMFLYLWISAILNLVMAHQYFVMLCLREQHNLLNAELKQVIDESKYLSKNPSRKGAFMLRCCALADQLDDIGKLLDHLQSMMIQLERVYGEQGLIVIPGYYVSSVANIFITYSLFKKNSMDLRLHLKNLILSFAWNFFFYMSGMLNLCMAFRIQDDHSEMIRMLEERTLFAPGLDVRLEQSFESLQLQLIRNPLKMSVLKLFCLSRQSSWANFGSILLNSISLIQYDIENFKK